MSQLEKIKERIKKIPSDFTYSELKSLLEKMGFVLDNKGKTSGSRVRFFRVKDNCVIILHKPHPGDIVKKYVVKNVVEMLEGLGEL